MALYHVYNQTVADGTATSVVRPSDWNSAHSQVMTIAGNTAGASTVSGTNVIFQGGNNVTLSANQAANVATIVVSAANQTVQTQASGNIVGAGYTSTTQAGSTVGVTHDSQGLSAAWPPFITTYAAQTTQTQNLHNVTLSGNTAGVMAQISSGTMTLAGGNNITLSQNGNAVTISGPNVSQYLTTARASNDAVGLNTALTGNGVAWTVNSSGISLNVPAFLTTARASNDAVGLNTALTGNGVAWTVNSSGISMNVPAFLTTAALSNHSHNFATTTTNGALIVVGTTNSAGATIGVPTFLTTARASNDAVGLNTAGTNVTWTVNSSGISFNGANYVGTGTTFAGANISGSMTHNSAGLNLSLSAPAPSGAGVTVSFMEPTPLIGTSLSSYGQNSLYFVPVKPLQNVSMTAVKMLVSINNATSNISHAVSQTISYGWYSLGTGASSTQMLSMATSSLAIIASYSSNLSGGYTLSQGANSTTYSSAGTGSTSAWTGQRIFVFPMATSIAEGGEFYFGMAQSTNSVGNTGAFRLSHVVLNNATNGSFGNMGPGSIGQVVSNASIIPNYGGFVYTATSGAWPSTIALSQRSIVSNIRPYIQLDA